MITGIVTAQREAILQLVLCEASGEQHEYKSVVDTGYTGWITLPPSVIAALNCRSTKTIRI